MEIYFDMTEINKMAANYAGGPKIVRDETTKAMARSVIAIEADAKRKVPTDTHNLQRSITHDVDTQGTSIIGRAGTNQPYAEAVEFGRRAGAPPPPSDALLGWMGRAGIEPDEGQTIAQLAFVIARSIGRKGIRPRPYLKPAFDANKAAITRELGTALMQRIMNRIGAGRG